MEENKFVRQVVSAGLSYMWIGLSRKIDRMMTAFTGLMALIFHSQIGQVVNQAAFMKTALNLS